MACIASAQELLPVNGTAEVNGVTIYRVNGGTVMVYGSSGVLIANGSMYLVTAYKEPGGLLIYGGPSQQTAPQPSAAPAPVPHRAVSQAGRGRTPAPLNPPPSPTGGVRPSSSNPPASPAPRLSPLMISYLSLSPLISATAVVSLLVWREGRRRCIDQEMRRLVDWLGARRPSLTPRELVGEAPPWAVEAVSRVVDVYEAYVYGGVPIECAEFKRAVSEAMRWRPVSMRRAADL
ncbi:hypothetical protein GCM10007981_16660 [Thermocladium modestius]|uniref:Protein-glutamine gamma-glutamyltransferase-like C-terminal domain-containing protein n=1 Tax=Thermocladium modestius TaxID=62609 RepID=A0A830GX48_9CREN|nr:hypothetical protein GCM10007981_16660 [Thermocladium modestius]